MAAVSSFYIVFTGIDANYDFNSADSIPDDAMLTMTFEVVEQATLSDTRVQFIYGDTPSANCMVAKGIAITPDGLVMMGKSGITAMLAASQSNYPESGDTTGGYPLYAKIGDTIYKSAPNEFATNTYLEPITFGSEGNMFLMSPVIE